MEEKEFDYWHDEIDINKLNNEGVAILKRKFVKGNSEIENYLTYPDKAPIVAKGISAFLFSNTYYGGMQLIPLTFKETKNRIDVSRYYQQYFQIRRKFTLQRLKSNPNTVNKDIEKIFLLEHIKQERKFYKNLKLYLSSVDNNDERKLRKKYVYAYIEWIKNKRNPLKARNYFELFLLLIVCFLIITVVMLEFFWIDKDWNYIQKINKLYSEKDELSKQIMLYFIPVFLGLFGICCKRIWKILNTYKLAF